MQVCVSSWWLSFFVVPSRSSNVPLYPLKVLQAKECAPTPYSFVVFSLNSPLSPLRSLGVHQNWWPYVYKIPLRVDPWGVKFILVKPKIYYCNFKTFCLCVRKVDWVLKPYIYIRGWWVFILLDDSKMYRLDQVFLFSKFSFAFLIYHKFWHCNYLLLKIMM
jgi:hypothetical protein